MTNYGYSGVGIVSMHNNLAKGRRMLAAYPPGRFARPSLLAIHCLLTWAVAWWAFVLILPGDTFATSTSFRMFAAVMLEDTWAYCFMGVTAIGVAGIVSSSCRLISGYVLTFAHALMAAMLMAAPPINTGTGIYSGLAVCAFYLLWQEQTRVQQKAPAE